MYKISVKRRLKPVEVDDVKGKKIKDIWKSDKFDPIQKLDLGIWAGTYGDIKSIDFVSETPISKNNDYDLDNPLDKQNILAFERELKTIEAEGLKQDLTFYGDPCDSVKFNLLAGFVTNSVVGIVPWYLVEYGFRKGALVERDGRWAVGAEEKGRTEYEATKTSVYNEFSKLWKGLRELHGRREYATKQNSERNDNLFGDK